MATTRSLPATATGTATTRRSTSAGIRLTRLGSMIIAATRANRRCRPCAFTAAAAAAAANDYTVETTDLGKETVAGHDCTKRKVTLTGKDSVKHEYTVWSASDLKEFPVKLVTTESGATVTMQFKDISLAKPATGIFDPPAGYAKYADATTMMRTEMMKRMGGGMGVPPQQ